MDLFNHGRRELLKLGGIGLVATAAPVAFAAEKSSAQSADGSHVPTPLFFDVRVYGAKGDGKNYDHRGHEQRDRACADAGGGTVYVPAGTYLCYSIHLRSNVEIYLAQGSVIVAAETPTVGASSGPASGYDAPEPDTAWNNFQDFGHNHWHNSLMWGEDLHDLSIGGPRTDLGQGTQRGAWQSSASPAVWETRRLR